MLIRQQTDILRSARHHLILLLLFILPTVTNAQMWQTNTTDSLYGNEWIDYESVDRYYKIKVGTDGIYQLDSSALAAVGIPVATVPLNQYVLYHNGKRIPLNVPRETGILQDGDKIAFYGRRNRAYLDQFLFQSPEEELLHPDYSMFSDTSVYFLTWEDDTSQADRFTLSENDLSGTLPEPLEWVWSEASVDYHTEHFKTYNKISGFDIYHSHFGRAEGFASKRSDDRDISLRVSHPVADGQKADLEMRLATNVGNHELQLTVQDEVLMDSIFSGVALIRPRFSIPVTGTSIPINIKGKLGNADQHVLASATLRYARQLVFDGENEARISLPPSASVRLLDIRNFATSVTQIELWDLTHQRIYTANRVGERFKLLYPSSDVTTELLLVASTAKRDAELATVFFDNYATRPSDFILLSHPHFIQPTNGLSVLQDYATYRASDAGGGYRPIIIDIEQLYDQFAYGVYGHPIAIRNFAHYIEREWSENPYFFIVGKGREYREVRTTEDWNTAVGKTFFVPTFGWPASDNLLLSSNNSDTPIFPIGRIAVQNNTQLEVYLNKVRQHETQVNAPQTIAGRAWMKSLLHLGGARGAEAVQIRQYLDNFERIVADGEWGGAVTSVYKTSTDPIEVARSETIFNRINEGVAIISFFGHSSPGSFDFNIDNPANYNNKGKYPLMLSFGCYSGNIFTGSTAISERFVFYENKGALAFGASRGLGFVSSLSQYGDRIYELASGELYGQSIGTIFQRTAAHFAAQPDIGIGTLREQYILQGDPALKLHSAKGPDFVVDATSVQIEPVVVNVQQDSFEVSFDVVNLGKRINDSLQVSLSQQLPNGTFVSLLECWIDAPTYRNTVRLKLPTKGRLSVGANRLHITLDKEMRIDESPAIEGEGNNELMESSGQMGIPFYAVDNNAFPVSPSPYAVVRSAKIDLQASTTDAFAPLRTYVFELDVNSDFDSAQKLRAKVTQRGGVVTWQPPIDLRAGQTYYWRVSPDSLNAAVGYLWETRSFSYLPDNSESWRQQSIAQLSENELHQISLNETADAFKFVDDTRDVYVKNKLFEPENTPEFVQNGTFFRSPWTWSVRAGINFVVLRPQTSRYWINPLGGDYGSVNTASNAELGYSYPTDTPENRKKAIDFLEDIVPDDHYVIVFTTQRTINSDYEPEKWAADSLLYEGKNLFNVLEKQGAQHIRKTTTRGAVPYLLIYQKGKGRIDESVADDIEDVITVRHTFPIAWFEGYIQTSAVGPAQNWKNANAVLDPATVNASDSIQMTLLGVQANGQCDTLLSDNTLSMDLSSVDADLYPYLGVRLYFFDEEERSVPRVKHIAFEYEPAAELALNPNRSSVFQDTIAAGQELRLELGIDNLAGALTDSLQVAFELTRSDGTTERLVNNYPPMPTRDSTTIRFSYPTDADSNIERVGINVNPRRAPQERYFLNNFGQRTIEVVRDRLNPLLQVTFNQQSLLQGDIIAPDSQIEIRLTDENPHLLLTDTALVVVKLTYPDGSTSTLNYLDNTVELTPATAERNELYAVFKPNFSQDGRYRINVEAKDVSSNLAGDIAYELDFEVSREDQISNVLAYPNPFTTSTRFVYTLTGVTPPAQYKIQILSVSGRVVRELTEADLGALKIGRHQTEGAWNGTDNFGAPLANGVYLYRLQLEDDNGHAYKSYETVTDNFFKAGFGKVVLLR